MTVADWRNIPLSYLDPLPLIEPRRGRPVGLCRHPAPWLGGEPCPREKGHPGECFWAVLFEHGVHWKAIVYRGAGRVKVARGSFSERPDGLDLLEHLQLLTRKRFEEAARRDDRGVNMRPEYDTRSITPAREDVAEPSNQVRKQEHPRESAASRAARAMVREANHGGL